MVKSSRRLGVRYTAVKNETVSFFSKSGFTLYSSVQSAKIAQKQRFLLSTPIFEPIMRFA